MTRIFMGSNAELVLKVRRIERLRSEGYQPEGVAVMCQGGCGFATYINDSSDLRDFLDGRLFCSSCRERAFYALPPQERRRVAENNFRLVAQVAAQIRAMASRSRESSAPRRPRSPEEVREEMERRAKAAEERMAIDSAVLPDNDELPY